MKSKVLLLVFFFSLISHPHIFAQTDFIKKNEYYMNLNCVKVFNSILKNGNIYKFTFKDINTIPYYEVNYCADLKNLDSLLTDYLNIDSSKSFGLLYKNNVLVAYEEQKYFGDAGINIISLSNLDVSKQDKRIKMVEFAKQHSSFLFFIQLPELKSRIHLDIKPILGFIEQNRLKFVDTSLFVYDNFTEAILPIYGGVEKYFELTKEKNDLLILLNKISIKNENRLLNCIDFLKRDYQKFCEYCSTDSERVTQLFISEVDSLLHLNSYQKKLLNFRLNQCINKSINVPPFLVGYDGVAFLGFDISTILKSILTTDQYSYYFKKRKMLIDISIKADLFINDYFMKKLHAYETIPNGTMIISIDSDKIKDAIKKDVFNCN